MLDENISQDTATTRRSPAGHRAGSCWRSMRIKATDPPDATCASAWN